MYEPWIRALSECRVVRGTISDGDLGECHWDGTLRVTRSAEHPLHLKLRVLLHECLHWVYPSKSEPQILKLEEYYWDRVSPKGMRLLLDALYPQTT